MINVEACLDLFDLTLKKRLLLYVFLPNFYSDMLMNQQPI